MNAPPGFALARQGRRVQDHLMVDAAAARFTDEHGFGMAEQQELETEATKSLRTANAN